MAAFSHANAAASAGGGSTTSLVSAAGTAPSADGEAGRNAGGSLGAAMGDPGAVLGYRKQQVRRDTHCPHPTASQDRMANFATGLKMAASMLRPMKMHPVG